MTFSILWNNTEGEFDGFVLEIIDSDWLSDPLEFRLPGEVRNFVVSNLMDATGYDIELYGISHGRNTPSVLAHAVTGTTYFTHILCSNSSIIVKTTCVFYLSNVMNELRSLLGTLVTCCPAE
uniref:Fibronectin type-III domain-containing protein n=1 Tax=Amphiprion percula TaxID=161767 RepID=A0A3P8RYE2_AMPPE